jgi:hypothetical protein
MSGITTLASDLLLDWLVGKTSLAAASTRYLTCSNALLPGGLEQMLAMTGSANRMALTPATYFTVAAAGNTITNQVPIVITPASTGDAVVNYISMWDNVLAGSPFVQVGIPTKAIGLGDNFTIPEGGLVFRIS